MEELIDESDTPKRRVRRTYTREFKTQLVAECTSGEKSIAQLSIEHRINANLIHKWTRQYRTTAGQTMLPVAVDAAAGTIVDTSSRIEVSIDERVVRFYGPVDSHSARMVLDLLR